MEKYKTGLFVRSFKLSKEVIMRRFGSLVLGAALGSFLGAALALIFAPTSGKRLREQITEYTQEIVLEVNQAAKQKRNDLESELDQLRQPQE
jgi:gas vesicle protein